MTTRQEIWDALYEKAHKLAEARFDLSNCDLSFGANTIIDIIVTERDTGEEAEFELDVEDYFGNVEDGFKALSDNLEDYVDLDEFKEAYADNLATQYADENIEDHEDEIDEEDD